RERHQQNESHSEGNEEARYESPSQMQRFFAKKVIGSLRGLESLAFGSKAFAASPFTIDLIVLGRAGVSNVGALATNYVAYTNESLSRSGVNARLRLVYSGMIKQSFNSLPFGPNTTEYRNLIIKHKPD